MRDPSGLPGAEEQRAELARQRAESRRRYTDYLVTVLIGCDDVADPGDRAAVILDALTVWRRDEIRARSPAIGWTLAVTLTG